MQAPFSELFYFTVREVRIPPYVRARLGPGGIWRPPRSHLDHIELGPQTDIGYHNETAYAYRLPANRVEDLRGMHPQAVGPGIAIYRTACLYYNQGIIWVVNYDPTEPGHNIEPRNDDDSSNEDEDEEEDESEVISRDWEMLQFHHLPSGSSWVDYAAGQDHIYASRSDQQNFQHYLVPIGYFPEPQNRNRLGNAPLGSLHGNLAVLIGLVVLQADPSSRTAVHENLRQCIRGPNDWRRTSQPYSSGWHNGRGIIIRVYVSDASRQVVPVYENTPLYD